VRRLGAGVAVAALLVPAAGGAGYGPAVDYALECQGCHRAGGEGTPGSVPALAGSVARFLAVPGGREFLVRVPGVSQAPLDDAALAAVIDWMLRRFDPGHLPAGFRPYTPEEVGQLRRKPLTDVGTERARIVGALGAADESRSRDAPPLPPEGVQPHRE